MKIYVIKSSYHSEPLATVRTDGTNLDWVEDNTDGKLPASVPNLQRLKQMCSNSSHLTMEEPSDQKIGLLRYVMANGDIVEITSDGASAMLNGTLLDEEHKSALMTAIANGGIKVAHKADTRQSIPIMATPTQSKLPERKPEIDADEMKAIQHHRQKENKSAKSDSSDHDSRIEDMDFGDTDAAMGKSLMYQLKYGVAKGERND